MKKTVVLTLVLSLCLALSACAGAGASGTQAGASDAAGTPNPVREATEDEIMEELGIGFNLPETAEDAVFSIIDSGDGSPVAQAGFRLDGHSFTYRIQPAAELKDISGMYYDWSVTEDVDVSYCAGELRYNGGNEGVITWYDAAPGLLYSLAMEDGAGRELLLGTAETLFVPVQGEVPGESVTYSERDDYAAWVYEVPDIVSASEDIQYLDTIDHTRHGSAGSSLSIAASGAAALSLARDLDGDYGVVESYLGGMSAKQLDYFSFQWLIAKRSAGNLLADPEGSMGILDTAGLGDFEFTEGLSKQLDDLSKAMDSVFSKLGVRYYWRDYTNIEPFREAA